MPKVALIKGPNLRDDGNVLVWEYLNQISEYDVVAFASDPPRYNPTDIDLPVRKLPWLDGRYNLFGYEHFFSLALKKARLPAGYLRGIQPLVDEFDILHTNENFNAFSIQAALATRNSDTKFTFTADENIPYPRFQQNPLLWKLKQFVNNSSDGIIAVTEATKRGLIHEGVPHNKINIVPSTVSLDSFNPDIHPEATRVGLPSTVDKEKLILFVHRLCEQKGTPYLLKAFEKIVANHSDVRLVLVGESQIQAELMDRISKNEQISWIERVPREKMPILYRISDIFTLPSVTMTNNEEQFGMSLLEAMASGLPAVVTDVGGLPHVADPGETALVVQERSSDELAAALETLIDDSNLRTQLGTAGRKRAEEVFAPTHVAESLKQFYDEVLV